MGGVKSRALRPFKGYNFENRAQKMIKKHRESSAPKSAPKHASSLELLEKHSKAHPEIMQELKSKDDDLVSRMNKLKIEQTAPSMQQVFSSTRKLPENRKSIAEPELAFEEPENIPEGKASLTQAHTFVNDHFSSSSKYTVKQISDEYKLDSAIVEQVLIHFRPLKVEFRLSEQFKKEHKKLTKTLEKQGFISQKPEVTEEVETKRLETREKLT